MVAEDDGGVRGYARYATKQSLGADFGQGVVVVREVLAADPRHAGHAVPLPVRPRPDGQHRAVELPVDDPLMHWLTNPRRAKPETGDALTSGWSTSTGRWQPARYAADVDVVLDVTDTRCPWNAGAGGSPAAPTAPPAAAPTTRPT